jgi:hypothetical protein
MRQLRTAWPIGWPSVISKAWDRAEIVCDKLIVAGSTADKEDRGVTARNLPESKASSSQLRGDNGNVATRFFRDSGVHVSLKHSILPPVMRR